MDQSDPNSAGYGHSGAVVMADWVLANLDWPNTAMRAIPSGVGECAAQGPSATLSAESSWAAYACPDCAPRPLNSTPVSRTARCRFSTIADRFGRGLYNLSHECILRR
jgi:hypothetical protein